MHNNHLILILYFFFIIRTVQPESTGTILDPTRLFSNFVSVFQSEEVPIPNITPSQAARLELFRELPFALKTLLQVWYNPQSKEPSAKAAKFQSSQAHEDEVANRYLIENHIRKLLDPIMAAYPLELVNNLRTKIRTKHNSRSNKSILCDRLLRFACFGKNIDTLLACRIFPKW
jgi:hypothetical protein